MVHRREVDGVEIVLGNQGDLFKRAMTWWDHDTGSIWSQPAGEAILGPRRGQRLELLPSALLTWGTWRAQHPGTLALDADGGRAGFDLEDLLLVVALGDAPPTAVAFTAVRAAGVVQVRVDGTPVAVVVPPPSTGAGASWHVLDRTLGAGAVADLVLRGGDLVDRGSGRRWTPLGRPLDGRGGPLQPLPAFTSFPRDYAAHFPDGRIVTP